MLEVGFPWDNFPCRGKFPRMNFRGEILHWGDLIEFLYEIILFVLLYLCFLNFVCRALPGELYREILNVFGFS